MRKVRELERSINSFQDTLRTRIYDEELHKYREVGSEKMYDFMDRYTARFEQFEDTRRKRIEYLTNERRFQRDKIEVGFESDPKLVMFKPKRELNEYLNNERLVALEERIEEAQNFRKELDKLSEKEKERLRKNMYQRSYLAKNTRPRL